MANSVYLINKGVNRSIEFRGLKAQYIWYLGGGLIALLVLFALLYISGVNTFIGLAIITILAGLLFGWIYKLSNIYGEFGLMKKTAKRRVPTVVKLRSRNVFFKNS